MTTKQTELLPAPVEPEQQGVVPSPPADQIVLMFERLAKDPAVDVTKLEKLIEMQERILRYNARAEYYAAFAAMQPEIPTIDEKGAILVGGEVRSRYATNEDIQEAVKPILQKHGFMLSFRTEFPDKTTVKVIAVLAHRSGHFEQTEFISAADTSGSKNSIQALGSAQSYGQRYTTRALLNIASRFNGDKDDDGHGVSRAGKPDVEIPQGYQDWLLDLMSCADEGWAKFSETWNRSKPEYRTFLTTHNRQKHEALKERAQAVSKKGNGTTNGRAR